MTDAVMPTRPPKAVLRTLNPVMRMLLRSRLHPAVDKAAVLLHITGRRTGRRFDIPVGRHELDGGLVVLTDAAWRLNLRGGTDIEVTRDGRREPMHADLPEDPAAVAELYRRVIDQVGFEAARRRLGLTVTVGRAPTPAEMTASVERHRLAAILLRPLPRGPSGNAPAAQ